MLASVALLLGLLFGHRCGHSSPGQREEEVPQRGAWRVHVLLNTQMPGVLEYCAFPWINQSREADAGLIIRTLTW